jgi:hypothetical protein
MKPDDETGTTMKPGRGRFSSDDETGTTMKPGRGRFSSTRFQQQTGKVIKLLSVQKILDEERVQTM